MAYKIQNGFKIEMAATDLAQILTIIFSLTMGRSILFSGGCYEPGCHCGQPVRFVFASGSQSSELCGNPECPNLGRCGGSCALNF